jgi:histidinol dehydrogenase
MQVISNPDRKNWKEILQRPYADNTAVYNVVQEILSEVKAGGDDAIRKLTMKFDKISLESFGATEEETGNAANEISEHLKMAIRQAKKNIETFHQEQVGRVEIVETMPGIECWRKSAGIEKVGLYIPGGTAPLFSSVLMLAVPARIAGCREVVLCTPSNKEGKVHPGNLVYSAAMRNNQNIQSGGCPGYCRYGLRHRNHPGCV